MAKYGIPDKFIAIVKSFHERMQVRFLDEGQSSETIQVTSGVKQGCVLVPTFFSMASSAMLKTAFHDDTNSMAIRYRTVERLPKRLVYGELSEGRRSTGGQRKSSPKAIEINNEFWDSLAAERGTWRSLIRKETVSYEQTGIRQAEEKRLLRKSSAAETSFAIITALPCPNCDRTFRARISLISHTRTHSLHATDQ